MFKFRFGFCFLFYVCIYNYSLAQTFKPVLNSEKILNELRKSSRLTNSIQADFHEEKHMAVLKESEKSSGVFYYKKNDKMRWEQQSPFKYIILINGDKLRIQDAGKEKNVGSASRMAAQIKELMIGLVNGDFQENKSFKQTITESPDAYQVTLIPVNKRMKNVYSKINLLFSKSTLRLKELSFFEKSGDKNIMKFQNEKINQSIAESVFLNL